MDTSMWSKKITIAVLCVCIVAVTIYLAGRMNSTSVIIKNNAMQVYNIDRASDLIEQDGHYYKYYSDFSEMEAELGIRFLENKDVFPHPVIKYVTDEVNWAFIEVKPYITGDTTILKRIEGKDEYAYTSGQKFASPLNLKISLIMSQEQLNIGLDKEYLGDFVKAESYTVRNGDVADIIYTTSGDQQGISLLSAVFVHRGIRYELQGHTSVEQMKEVLDSFE